MRLIMLLFFCLAFIGCGDSRKNESVTKIPLKEKLDSAEILRIEVFKLLETEKLENRTFFVANSYAMEAALTRFNRIHLSDENYVLPSRKFINDVILVAYTKFITENRINYNERFDCDDFSRTFALFASICNNLEGPNGFQGIAVGELWYMREDLIGKTSHAINIIVTSDQEVIFIEPQNGKLIHLSDSEIASTKMVRF